MYKLIDYSGTVFNQYQYEKEDEFERVIVENSQDIFGKNALYFDVKKKIGKSNQGAAIPDGYLLDFSLDKPQLYFVEVELSSHDVFNHIAPQIFKFAISSELTKHKMLNILLDEIEKDDSKKKFLESYIKTSKYANIDALLRCLIFDQDAAVIIIIDKLHEEGEENLLGKALRKINITSSVYLFETYISGEKKIHRFIPFQDDVLESVESGTDIVDVKDSDTIVVPAQEDGFNSVFIEKNAWWSIRISTAMLEKIKYIAAYQVAPVSAITYFAEVDHIEKYLDTNKYAVYFKNKAQKLENPVKLGASTKGIAPQAPRYTTLKCLKTAKSITDIWSKS